MAYTADDTAIMEDLEDLFAWNPQPFRLATKEMGGSFSTTTRDPSWYDMHLAPDRICRKIVHAKDLHRKVAAVVDEKLRVIRERGISLDPPSARGYTDKIDRQLMLRRTSNPAQNELSIQSYYSKLTSEFCVYVASTLALHPHIWRAVVEWSPTPFAQVDAVCDGSLRLLYLYGGSKRQADGTMKHSGPDFVDPNLWQELLEISEKYGDMATWEMKSVSVGDGSLMLGVMALATGKESFEWLVCMGGEDHRFKSGHYAPCTTQLMDDPDTMSRFALEDAQLTSQAYSDASLDEILDDALRRGGSSLEKVQEFDRKLMQEAKGTVHEGAKHKGGEVTEAPTSKAGNLESGPPNSVPPHASEGELPSARPNGFWKSATSAFRKRSQDDHVPSSKPADSSSVSPASALHKLSQCLRAPQKGKLKISTALKPFNLRRKSSRKRSPSKSPRKNARAGTKDKKADRYGGPDEGEGEGLEPGEDGRPLTAHSVIQQVSYLVWSPLICERKPYFIVIGMGSSGTCTIYHLHPPLR
jgi:hypothetical protein